jgi:MFS family permease
MGRRTATTWTLIIMGVGAAGIGFLPSSATIGVTAPVLLNILRICQGIGLGGEAGAGSAWIIEAATVAKSKHRGFWSSWVQFGVGFAQLTGGMVTSYLIGFGTVPYISFNWRIPFFIGAVVAVIGAFARFKLMESPLFVRIREERKLVKNPAVTVLREKWKVTIPLIVMHIPQTCGSALVAMPYTMYFLAAFRINPAFIGGVGTYTGIGACIATVVGAVLCDRVGRKIFCIITSIIGILCVYPYFMAMGAAAVAGNELIMILLLMGWSGGTNMLNGVLPAISAESYETKYRISGAGLSLQLSTLITGIIVSFGLSYIIAGASASVDKVWPLVAGLMMIVSLAGLIASLLLKETKDIDMTK